MKRWILEFNNSMKCQNRNVLLIFFFAPHLNIFCLKHLNWLKILIQAVFGNNNADNNKWTSKQQIDAGRHIFIKKQLLKVFFFIVRFV